MALDDRWIRPGRLTTRERQIIDLVASGRTNAEIARSLGLRRPTVARLLSNAMVRLGAERRAHAVVLAAEPIHGPHPAVPTLPADGRALLGLLAEGATLGAAAASLGLSRRTADRRLAEARAALNVEHTVEAVARLLHPGAFGRLGSP
jgi:DNA-binding CsgD family transcriptional regulator